MSNFCEPVLPTCVEQSLGEPSIKQVCLIIFFNRNQKGAVRTNCIDCIDRTNSVQSYLGLEVC